MQPSRQLTSRGLWQVECGDDWQHFERKNEISAYLSELVSKQSSGRINVSEDVGDRSWVSRFVFRMHPRILQMHIALEWSGTAASLIFFDDNASEFWGKDREQLIHPDETTRKAIAHGSFLPLPLDRFVAVARALRAIDEYLTSGSRPTWLDYDYVA